MPRYNRVVADFGQGNQLGSGKSPGILSVYFESNPVWVFVHWHAYKEKLKEIVHKSKQIPNGKLFWLPEIKFDFPI